MNIRNLFQEIGDIEIKKIIFVVLAMFLLYVIGATAVVIIDANYESTDEKIARIGRDMKHASKLSAEITRAFFDVQTTHAQYAETLRRWNNHKIGDESTSDPIDVVAKIERRRLWFENELALVEINGQIESLQEEVRSRQ